MDTLKNPISSMPKLEATLQKILALAEHPRTPHNESAAAWRMLHKILNRHGLTLADIPRGSSGINVVTQVIFSGKVLPSHFRILCGAIADILNCETLISRRGPKPRTVIVSYIGKAHKVTAAEYLVRSIPHRIEKAFWELYGPHLPHPAGVLPPRSRVLFNAFYAGYANGVHSAYAAAPDIMQPSVDDKALMVLEKTEIEAYIKDKHGPLKTTAPRKSEFDKRAFSDGFHTGKKDPFTTALPEVPANAPR